MQPPGDYLWKVVASNGGNLSAPSLSNTLNKLANGTLRGVVSNEDGDPLPDAMVECGSLFAATNNLGEYYLSMLPGTYTITVSCQDYQTQTLNRVSVQSGQETLLNVTLESTVSNADDLAPIISGIQNVYPNPFRENASIELILKDTANPYTLSIYNLRGELVHRQTGQQTGKVNLNWNGRDSRNRQVAPGIYFIRLKHGPLMQQRKLIHL